MLVFEAKIGYASAYGVQFWMFCFLLLSSLTCWLESTPRENRTECFCWKWGHTGFMQLMFVIFFLQEARAILAAVFSHTNFNCTTCPAHHFHFPLLWICFTEIRLSAVLSEKSLYSRPRLFNVPSGICAKSTKASNTKPSDWGWLKCSHQTETSTNQRLMPNQSWSCLQHHQYQHLPHHVLACHRLSHSKCFAANSSVHHVARRDHFSSRKHLKDTNVFTCEVVLRHGTDLLHCPTSDHSWIVVAFKNGWHLSTSKEYLHQPTCSSKQNAKKLFTCKTKIPLAKRSSLNSCLCNHAQTVEVLMWFNCKAGFDIVLLDTSHFLGPNDFVGLQCI